ncbi:UNVERIFIED_CONTAM: Nuclear transport factor 2A [Sesamum calycinum]|uniref:Nuclear transport factor 2A n=1 Tax=Sesamum calycinum TaxID=2727403 RepID=A0AAW2MLJ7_9LAMI
MDPDAVAKAFVEHYYSTFDANRAGLANLYQDGSMLTFEGQKIMGSQNIVAKLTSLPFQQCQHAITTVDCQPSGPAGGMLVFVSGNLQLAGEQHALKFSQSNVMFQFSEDAYPVIYGSYARNRYSEKMCLPCKMPSLICIPRDVLTKESGGRISISHATKSSHAFILEPNPGPCILTIQCNTLSSSYKQRAEKSKDVGLGACVRSGGALRAVDARFADSVMADWGPVLIGVVLFILLQPGLLFQLPGNNRQVEFGSMKTNGKAIAVHTLIFFALYAILILAVHVHIYTG